MNRRILTEMTEAANYLKALGHTVPPDGTLDGEHVVHLICGEAGRCLDREHRARDIQTQRSHLLRIAALALLRVERIDAESEDPYPVGLAPESRGSGH